MQRYYYYRCTSTFKKDWNNCQIKQVNANRLEEFIFKNLERISNDKHYLDSLIFKLKYMPAGDRIGLEQSKSCFESAKISAEIFAQTLQHFLKILPDKKSFEKNLWAKKFIKNIVYSKQEISITLYYKRVSEQEGFVSTASGRVGAAAGRNQFSAHQEKTPLTNKDKRGCQEWLPVFNSPQTITITLPNAIHACRKKNL